MGIEHSVPVLLEFEYKTKGRCAFTAVTHRRLSTKQPLADHPHGFSYRRIYREF
jgi:hypothetical protein